MSPKSQQPKGKKKADGKKGKKGKRGKKDPSVTTVVIEETPDLPPFGYSVILAVVLSIPSILGYVDGNIAFDAMILRYLAALVVSWALVNLVHGVIRAFRKSNESTVEAATIDHLAGEMLTDNYRVPGDGGYSPPSERDRHMS